MIFGEYGILTVSLAVWVFLVCSIKETEAIQSNTEFTDAVSQNFQTKEI